MFLIYNSIIYESVARWGVGTFGIITKGIMDTGGWVDGEEILILEKWWMRKIWFTMFYFFLK